MRRCMEQGGATGIEIKYNVTLHGRYCNRHVRAYVIS